MIDIAARATNGVKIPGRKATRAEIKQMFKDHLTNLKAKLNVRTFVETSVWSYFFLGSIGHWRDQFDM
jgi:hypothetical protein